MCTIQIKVEWNTYRIFYFVGYEWSRMSCNLFPCANFPGMRGVWSWNNFYGHSLPSTDWRKAVVSYWRKNVHQVLVNCLGGLPRNSVNMLNDRARNYLKVSKGRKAPTQPQLMFAALSRKQNRRKDFCTAAIETLIMIRGRFGGGGGVGARDSENLFFTVWHSKRGHDFST